MTMFDGLNWVDDSIKFFISFLIDFFSILFSNNSIFFSFFFLDFFF